MCQNFPDALWSTRPMKLSRRLRSLAAFLALVGVLFSQLALATYACPGAQEMALAAVAVEASKAAPDCGEGMAESNPALCAAHCQQADQSRDKPATPAVPAITWVAILPGLAVLMAAPDAVPTGEQPSLLARVTAPSLAVRHCCFRV